MMKRSVGIDALPIIAEDAGVQALLERIETIDAQIVGAAAAEQARMKELEAARARLRAAEVADLVGDVPTANVAELRGEVTRLSTPSHNLPQLEDAKEILKVRLAEAVERVRAHHRPRVIAVRDGIVRRLADSLRAVSDANRELRQLHQSPDWASELGSAAMPHPQFDLADASQGGGVYGSQSAGSIWLQGVRAAGIDV